jgi:hypothetical protein
LLVGLALCALGLSIAPDSARAYALEGKSWPSGTTVTFQMGLGSPVAPLLDGSTSWNTAALPALAAWNEKISRAQLTAVVGSTVAAGQNDHVCSMVFSPTVFGGSFGSGVLAVTYYVTQGSTMTEADILFNTAQTFDSYRGPLRFGGPRGFALADIRRVLIHELGHALGLNHPDGAGQNVDAIMNATISDRETLASDDIAGGQFLYGAPAPTPTPTPIPTTGPSRLANISTRMKVGRNDEVLIGGFIIRGTQPKRMVLRASGPSLAALGVPGAMQDPVLELKSSTGATIASNDNWQTGAQAGEIQAAGLAPSRAQESALAVTLQSGSYTAVVQGVNSSTGVALVEGYELDTPTTRLVNLSTRGRIGTGDEALIGGIIVQGSAAKPVIVRAIGPSLTPFISGALADPTLELRNSSGVLLASNDNWSSSAQAAQITASSLAPSSNKESAIMTTLNPGAYTAIVRGVNSTSGVGLIEVFDLEP